MWRFIIEEEYKLLLEESSDTNVIVFTHGADIDGLMSGYVAKYFLFDGKAKVYSIDYGRVDYSKIFGISNEQMLFKIEYEENEDTLIAGYKIFQLTDKNTHYVFTDFSPETLKQLLLLITVHYLKFGVIPKVTIYDHHYGGKKFSDIDVKKQIRDFIKENLYGKELGIGIYNYFDALVKYKVEGKRKTRYEDIIDVNYYKTVKKDLQKLVDVGMEEIENKTNEAVEKLLTDITKGKTIQVNVEIDVNKKSCASMLLEMKKPQRKMKEIIKTQLNDLEDEEKQMLSKKINLIDEMKKYENDSLVEKIYILFKLVLDSRDTGGAGFSKILNRIAALDFTSHLGVKTRSKVVDDINYTEDGITSAITELIEKVMKLRMNVDKGTKESILILTSLYILAKRIETFENVEIDGLNGKLYNLFRPSYNSEITDEEKIGIELNKDKELNNYLIQLFGNKVVETLSSKIGSKFFTASLFNFNNNLLNFIDKTKIEESFYNKLKQMTSFIQKFNKNNHFLIMRNYSGKSAYEYTIFSNNKKLSELNEFLKYFKTGGREAAIFLYLPMNVGNYGKLKRVMNTIEKMPLNFKSGSVFSAISKSYVEHISDRIKNKTKRKEYIKDINEIIDLYNELINVIKQNDIKKENNVLKKICAKILNHPDIKYKCNSKFKKEIITTINVAISYFEQLKYYIEIIDRMYDRLENTKTKSKDVPRLFEYYLISGKFAGSDMEEGIVDFISNFIPEIKEVKAWQRKDYIIQFKELATLE